MTLFRALRFASLVLVATLLGTTSAFAQATRTWVSGVGDDANPCSRTAPCKTFAGAISKTATGGEIDALDPGGFGAVTITKSITLDGTGPLASVLGAGTNGIVINAPTNAVVVLRNLSINGAGSGLDGVKLFQAGALTIEGCVIFGMTQKGIELVPTSNTQVTVKDTTVRSSVGGALLVKPDPGFFANVTVDNSRFEGSLFGIRVEDGGKVTANRSIGSNNTNNGFLVVGGVSAELNLEGSVASNNGTNGIATSGNSNAIVRLSNTTVTNNGTGLNATGGGQILTYGSNRIAGNTAAGASTGNVGEQ